MEGREQNEATQYAFNPPRGAGLAVTVVVSACLVVWAVLMAIDYTGRSRWSRLEHNGTVALLDAAIEPRRADEHLRLSRLYLDETLPPDLRRAEQHARAALEISPRRSDAWMVLARAQLFSGDRTGASESIRRADQLDPAYLTQRLRALQLRVLLGETDETWRVASGIVRLDAANREELIVRLTQAGFSPRQIYEGIRAHELDAPLLGIVLQSFPRNITLDELAPLIPEQALADRAFQDQVLPSALASRSYRLLERLWRHRHVDQQGLIEAGILTSNHHLAQNLVEDEQELLGWIRPRSVDPYFVLWKKEGEGQGIARLLFSPDAYGATQKEPRWHFHRLVLRGDQPVTIEVPAEVSFATGGMVWVTASHETQTIRSTAMESGKGAGVLRLELPATGKPTVVSLHMDVRFVRTPESKDQVVVGPLEFLVDGERVP